MADLQQDPFYEDKDYVARCLPDLLQLHESWRSLLQNTNTATSNEFKFCDEQLKKGIKEIEEVIADLEQSVRIVESDRLRFKLTEEEVKSRRRFIESSRQKFNTMKDNVNSAATKGKIDKDQRELLKKQQNVVPDKYQKIHDAFVQDNNKFIENQNMRTQAIIQKQEQDLSKIEESINKLKDVSMAIDETITTQTAMIDDIDKHVDKVDTGIRGAIQKVNKLIESTNEKTQWIVIGILAFIFILLLLLIFLVKPSTSTSTSTSSTS